MINQPKLAVYVAGHCSTCARSRELVAAITVRWPALGLRVFDLDDESNGLPDPVVAIPAFVLDGRVIALGNPTIEEVADVLDQIGKG